MSFQKTPLRNRYSASNLNGSTVPSTPARLSRSSSSASNSDFRGQPKIPDLRRPPSSRGFRSTSPLHSSRPGSAMGNSSSGSRPTTPSMQRIDPYTGTITVSIRPNPHSLNPNFPSPWSLDTYSNSIGNNQDQSSFNFDNVFLSSPETQNYSVYEKCCSGLVQSFLQDAYNATVFAYGMTGSGKTYSMRGSERDPGFVKLAIDDIFSHITQQGHSKQFKLTVSYLEIYNERIVDLLSSTPSASMDLKIRDDSIYGNKIIGLNSIEISSQNQLLELINTGDNKRRTSATDFNARSSRSHAILQIKLNTVDLASGTENNSTLSLCDLAGSERATTSVERRKEGAFINKSLLALSTVINKLSVVSNGQNTSAMDHIPYRDSKLTRLLQPALSGSSLISVLCTIHLGADTESNLHQQFVSETYNTLRFAARARNIVMNVVKNKATNMGETNPEALKIIDDLRRTVEKQANELDLLKSTSFKSNFKNGDSNHLTDKDLQIAELQGENTVLNEKIDHLTRLIDLQNTETIILKNESLNDILGCGLEGNAPQMMMANLEEFYKRVNHEMEESKSYITVLENKVRLQSQQLAFTNEDQNSMSIDPPSQEAPANNGFDMESVLKDQEEEILYLKELIKDKDHIIKGLTKTSKLRKLMESNAINIQDDDDKKPSMVVEPEGKENNNFGELKSFKINRSPEINRYEI